MPMQRALKAVENSADLARKQRMIHIGKHRTSIRLEEPTWRALLEIAEREGFTVNDLCTAIHAKKPRALRFTDALRLSILHYYREAATKSRKRLH